MIRAMLKTLKWLAIALVVIVLMLLAPVGYVETFCRGTLVETHASPLMTDPAQLRAEANTYLTYPEWHIVYAYDGIAEVLKHGDEYGFGYLSSVAGFWSSTCDLMAVADAHGGADGATRLMIHTIGASFTLEMAMKAAYEDMLGGAFALLRGPQKTPQDIIARDMAVDYAGFLRQTPWYKYDFERWRAILWNAPIENGPRGWERRLALGGEWRAKTAYASAIAAGVAATEEAKLTIWSLVDGLPAADLAAMPDIGATRPAGDRVLIETPRYDIFTHIIADVTAKGGRFVEIAGNDDIMVSLTLPRDVAYNGPGVVISRFGRDGFDGERLLVSVKTADLGAILKAYPIGEGGVEHIFDY